MKKLLVLGLVALSLLLSTRQEASAWSKFNFSWGMNVSWEKENTCLLWGLYKSGPRFGGGVDGDFPCPPPGGDHYSVPAVNAPVPGPLQGQSSKVSQTAQPVSYNQYYQNPYGYSGYNVQQQTYSQYAVPSYWGSYNGW